MPLPFSGKRGAPTTMSGTPSPLTSPAEATAAPSDSLANVPLMMASALEADRGPLIGP